jgi:hypothetical protein
VSVLWRIEGVCGVCCGGKVVTGGDRVVESQCDTIRYLLNVLTKYTNVFPDSG